MRSSSGTFFRGGHGVLSRSAAAYLMLLPLGSALTVPVGDAIASGTDVLLGALLLVAGVSLVRSPGIRSTAGRMLREAGDLARVGRAPSSVGYLVAGLALLAGFAAWTGASAAWGFHPGFAVAKSAAYACLVLGVFVVAVSGLPWDDAMDAWLTGAFVAVALSFVAAAAAGVAVWTGTSGPDGWVGRVFFSGGSVSGLPVDRLQWPFLHPNGLGDYLVVTAAIAWARWPALVERSRGGSVHGLRQQLHWIGAVLLAVALVLTFSSAWLAAGVLLLLWGRSFGRSRSAALFARAAGAVLAAGVLAAIAFPLRVEVAGRVLESSGIRAPIWVDGVRAFTTSPITGVGAAPRLADTVNPADPAGAPLLWDAHNAYLSILGQLGLVGAALAGGGLLLVILALRRPRRTGGRAEQGVGEVAMRANRARTGILLALVAMAVHGAVIAGEDLRHWWGILALAGAWIASAAGEEPS